jgi:hypothetical protein
VSELAETNELLARIEALLRAQSSPRLAYKPDEAAAILGVSRDFFDEHVAPQLRIVRESKLRLVPARELERYIDEKASRAVT